MLTESDREVICSLKEMKVNKVEEFVYTLRSFDGRRTLQTIVSESGHELSLPTKYLKKLGITHRGNGLMMRVIEFDSGEILSYFRNHEFQIADEVLGILAE